MCLIYGGQQAEGYRYLSIYYIHLICLENEGGFPQEELKLELNNRKGK